MLNKNCMLEEVTEKSKQGNRGHRRTKDGWHVMFKLTDRGQCLVRKYNQFLKDYDYEKFLEIVGKYRHESDGFIHMTESEAIDIFGHDAYNSRSSHIFMDGKIYHEPNLTYKPKAEAFMFINGKLVGSVTEFKPPTVSVSKNRG